MNNELVNSWVSVSAVYPNGSESLRARAISSTLAPSVTITNDAEDEPCLNQPVIYQEELVGANVEYNWQFGTTGTPTESSSPGPVAVIYTSKGPAVTALTVTNEGGQDQDFKLLTVIDKPQDGSFDIDVVTAAQITYEANVPDADTYMWDFGDGNTGEGETVSHTYTENGLFEVTLVASNKCGSITRKDEINIFITTSTEDFTEENFTISPNPSDGNVEISFPSEGTNLELTITSMEGKLVRKITSDQMKGSSILIQDIPSGLYSVQLRNGQRVMSRRLVVK